MMAAMPGCSTAQSSTNISDIAETSAAIVTEIQETSLHSQNENTDRIFPYRFVDREEAVHLYLSNTAYFENATAYDMQFKTQQKDADLERLKQYGANQMQEFSDTEKENLTAAMDEIETMLKEKGFHLPPLDEIQFIRSTQFEEGCATAYTHGTQIYMDGLIPIFLAAGEQNHQKGISILLHELFHCLTRNDPAFRKDMYALIGFQVMEHDFDIPESVQKIALSNPDVEHHDAYAAFTIDGQKKDCGLVIISTQPYENGDDLFSHLEIALVPVHGDVNEKDYYVMDDAEDFWEVVGQNTDYVIDPEECMADNFGYALTYGLDGGMNYRTPHIIQGILNLVQSERYQ